MEDKIQCHTFGFGMYNNNGKDPLRNYYCKCTRKEIFEATNGMFAFSYDVDDFDRQIKEYNLIEISVKDLNSVVMV